MTSPKHVHMDQGGVVFESVEEHVATWITFIDQWTVATTTRYAEFKNL